MIKRLYFYSVTFFYLQKIKLKIIKVVKEIFKDLLAQNILSNSFSLNMIDNENISTKLNEQTSSVGFIYRHIGETMLLFGYFFGMPSEIQNKLFQKHPALHAKGDPIQNFAVLLVPCSTLPGAKTWTKNSMVPGVLQPTPLA